MSTETVVRSDWRTIDRRVPKDQEIVAICPFLLVNSVCSYLFNCLNYTTNLTAPFMSSVDVVERYQVRPALSEPSIQPLLAARLHGESKAHSDLGLPSRLHSDKTAI